MPLELINPPTLHQPQSYTHVAVSSGGIVFIAGQAADDADGHLVGVGDLAAQARQAFANLGRALASAGARPTDVAKITIYVVGHRPENLPVIEAARVEVFGDHKPTDTLVGVETLAEPGHLIEVDAIAVLDRRSASAAESDVLAVSADWDAALVTNDAEAAAAFMGDEWVYVGSTGPTSKADLVGWIATGRLAHHSMRPVGRPRVARHGDAVTLIARKASTGAWDGVPYAADEWISEVFVERDGRWRCVLSAKCPAED